jgi:hypothetical protein
MLRGYVTRVCHASMLQPTASILRTPADKIEPLADHIPRSQPKKMPQPYNVQAALDEVIAEFQESLGKVGSVSRISHTVAAIVKACDDEHRAIFYMEPSLESIFEAALLGASKSLAADNSLDARTITTMEDLIEYAGNRLTFATQSVEDIGATFNVVVDGRPYMAEIAGDHLLESVVVAGKLIPSEDAQSFENIPAWLEAYGLGDCVVLANYAPVLAPSDDEYDSY